MKNPWSFPVAIRQLRRAIKPFPKAAMFELAEHGHDSLFEQLVACILSVRTRDEVSLPTALKLFARARTPAAILELGPQRLDSFIRASSFHRAKVQQILSIARAASKQELPCDADTLQQLPGIGPKCAHLALGIACGQNHLSVDIHVHRVTNRWGIVKTPTPERTMQALQSILPKRYWTELNSLLVPFGKHICTGTAPKCSECPLLEMCLQVGVTTHR